MDHEVQTESLCSVLNHGTLRARAHGLFRSVLQDGPHFGDEHRDKDGEMYSFQVGTLQRGFLEIPLRRNYLKMSSLYNLFFLQKSMKCPSGFLLVASSYSGFLVRISHSRSAKFKVSMFYPTSWPLCLRSCKTNNVQKHRERQRLIVCQPL